MVCAVCGGKCQHGSWRHVYKDPNDYYHFVSGSASIGGLGSGRGAMPSTVVNHEILEDKALGRLYDPMKARACRIVCTVAMRKDSLAIELLARSFSS